MTPLQKLTRLAQIERQLLAIDPMNGCEIRRRLEAERESIMRGIGHPPSYLANIMEPETWAHAMAETFPNTTQEEIFAWLDMYRSAVYDKGRETGTKEAIDHINAGTQGLIDALRLIRDGVKDGSVMDERISVDGRMTYMADHITRTLKAAGLT